MQNTNISINGWFLVVSSSETLWPSETKKCCCHMQRKEKKKVDPLAQPFSVWLHQEDQSKQRTFVWRQKKPCKYSPVYHNSQWSFSTVLPEIITWRSSTVLHDRGAWCPWCMTGDTWGIGIHGPEWCRAPPWGPAPLQQPRSCHSHPWEGKTEWSQPAQ